MTLRTQNNSEEDNALTKEKLSVIGVVKLYFTFLHKIACDLSHDVI